MAFVTGKQKQKLYLRINKPEVAGKFERHTVGKAPPDLVHSLVFSRRAFPKKRSVRSWLPLNGYRTSHVALIGDEWVVRVGNARAAEGEPRVVIAPGVEAVVGIPRSIMVGKATGLMAAVHHGASGPSNHTPEMPDFESLYAQPEAKARQQKEAEQSEDRRRSTWRDLNFSGFHGATNPDKPELRYISGVTSTGRIATIQPRLVLSAKELKANQQRVQRLMLGYDVVQGETRRRKKGNV